MNIERKLVIVGGGPAGLAAAVGALDAGISPDDILIIERDKLLGGILNQCIHAGFGLHRFGEELTGPEYADKYIKMVEKAKIPYVTNSMVLSITEDREVTYASSEEGIVNVKAGAIVLAMGCRERTRGALNIPGTRPAGVFSAGTAQRYVNINGFLPGKKVVILGSGDIGLIMARRMTLEGAEVMAVCELMSYSSGLARNIAQCLDDFGIPLHLSHTVVQIHGRRRLEGVTIAEVDKQTLKPIEGTERFIECDALLLSCGLIPENELSLDAGITLDPITGGAIVDDHRQTTTPGVFACGNVLHVHDLVDFVSEESALAGYCAAKYAEGTLDEGDMADTCPENGIRYVVPQHFCAKHIDEKTKFFMRVRQNYRNVSLVTYADGVEISRKKLLRAAPGEMECVSLKGEALEKAQNCHMLSFAIVE